MKNYFEYFRQLKNDFHFGNESAIGTKNFVRFFPFHSAKRNTENEDRTINENFAFQYPVLFPEKTPQKFHSAIVLLHGLNERNWDKYLTWADIMCCKTGKPVILFPIAFHINRSPTRWSDPRKMQDVMHIRYDKNGKDRNLTFANVAISDRISEQPYRFYSAGRQSTGDVLSLISDIKAGKHQAFTENTQINFFSYSIGAFLAQTLFLQQGENLLQNAKLFMFCGGSIFSAMCGISRSIMDKMAFERLYNFYMYEFAERESSAKKDGLFCSFFKMIRPENDTQQRITAFEKMKNRISGIALAKDRVIPFLGISLALGNECAAQCVKCLDFDFSYTHETPFPTNESARQNSVLQAFNAVFEEAAGKLG